MKHLFAPYSLALLAKEKGFDEPCLYEYAQHDDNEKDIILRPEWTHLQPDWPYGKVICAAPLYQQLVDWFREKRHVFISLDIDWSIKEDDGYYFTVLLNGSKRILRTKQVEGETYHEALTAALIEAFKLI